jgi:hypothetical protein
MAGMVNETAKGPLIGLSRGANYKCEPRTRTELVNITIKTSDRHQSIALEV